MRRILPLVPLVLVAVVLPAQATELCGNGVDDDANGLVDEGCYPTLTTGVCESPLSCGDTGMVSWGTGSLHYDLPPDIAPAVPYGPGIGFRRFYTSMYSPAIYASGVNPTPLGSRWQHTYLTWVYDSGVNGANLVLHTSEGREVLYTSPTSCGTNITCYTPQAGDHVITMKKDSTGATPVYYVQLLKGETLKYNNVGQLIEIWDNLAPTPNKVLVTWTSTSGGNVSTVTDASGERRLLFNYTNNLLTSINFQLYDFVKAQWATQHTTTYDYTNGVTRDSTSQWFVPQSSTEWNELLAGTDIPSPTNMWKCQETTGNLADSIGSSTLTATNNGGMTYNVTVSGWTRKAVALTDNQTSKWQSASTWCNPKTTKCSAFGLVALTALPSSSLGHDVVSIGDSNGARAQAWKDGTSFKSPDERWDGSNTASWNHDLGTLVHAWVLAADPVNLFTQLQVGTAIMTPTWATGTSAAGYFTMGALGSNSGPAQYLYMAGWNNAALNATQQQTLVTRIQNGAGLSQVTIGSQNPHSADQKYTYNDGGYLNAIFDGAGNQVVAFAYSSTNAGEVDLITTSRGTIGFDFNTSRSGCTAGNTVLYFNKGNATSCNVDADCGTGYMCGGKTGTGSTGTCFLAARCMTKSTVNNETVITNISALGPGGGACSGACTDVMQYLWTAGGSGNINVTGREDPLLTNTGYTDITYNSNGLPTQIKYGASDSSGTGANRTVYMFYDSTYPGRLLELRRASDLDPNASSCSSLSTTGCQRTIYCYGSSCSASCAADNQLCTLEKDGDTLNTAGTVVSFASKITFVHDTKGRISEVDGAVSGIKTVFEYNGSSSNATTDNFLADFKIYKDATNYLQPQIMAYDFWGHPTALKGPDGNFTCDTYDSSRGYLSSRRRDMNNQTDCNTSFSSDLTTSWSRDSWLRLTQLTRPDGSIEYYYYDSLGRLSSQKRMDSACVSSCVGDYQTFSYSTPGTGAGCPGLDQICEIDTYDSSNSLTAKQPYTYYAGRQLQDVVNPVNTSQFTGFVYDSAGKVTEVDGASSLSKTLYHFDGAAGRDNRVTSEERFKTSSTSDTWSLLYSWMGLQAQVTDPDSKITGSTRDDSSRLVKMTSPDLAGPTVRVYDSADRLTNLIEDQGGGVNEVDSAFTYDNMNRQLSADYGARCPTGTTHQTIIRSFDTLPTGVTCPTGSGQMHNACTFTTGRLAYVQTVLMCSSSYSDGSLDQQTYFAYDQAGHVIEEYTTDDSGRAADTQYSYTANGALKQITTPSSAIIGFDYSSANASDLDLITKIWRTSSTSPVIDSVAYFPWGAWKSYNWETTIGGVTLKNTVDRNVAYRITAVHGALQGSTENAKVAITEDALGRVTSRVYTPHDPTLPGLFDSYFTYDEQSRVVCEATASGACPASGSSLKNNHDQTVPFKAAGDWVEILRPIAGSTGGTINNFNATGTNYGTSHQVTDVNQSNGTPSFGHTSFAFDARGLRSYDDNTTTLTNDRRDYTYDARRNLINVRGQYFTGGAWHYYDVASAYDDANRRVFKSFYDETTLKTAQWFFYYDAFNRLTEIRYTPDISVTSTYSIFQIFWLGDKLVLYWESDYTSNTLTATSKRYVASDEKDRPIQLWNWPSSGDATRVWAINPTAWGFDTNIVGPTVFQPIMFAGQYKDTETTAYENDGATVHRPGLCTNGFRTYDPFVGGYVQIDPMVEDSWTSYIYVNSDPVGDADPDGRFCIFCTCPEGDENCDMNQGGGGGGNGSGGGSGSGGGGNGCSLTSILLGTCGATSGGTDTGTEPDYGINDPQICSWWTAGCCVTNFGGARGRPEAEGHPYSALCFCPSQAECQYDAECSVEDIGDNGVKRTPACDGGGNGTGSGHFCWGWCTGGEYTVCDYLADGVTLIFTVTGVYLCHKSKVDTWKKYLICDPAVVTGGIIAGLIALNKCHNYECTGTEHWDPDIGRCD